MLRYFRINDPYRLIALFLLLTLASLPLLINMPGVTIQELKGIILGEAIGDKLLYSEIIDHSPPLMALTDGFLDFIFGRSVIARHIVALILIFFQASYFAVLLINNKAYNENSYLPALVFGFLCFFSFDLLALSPELFASILLLMALNNLFKEVEFRVERDSIVLNLGVFLGLASLFVFSYTVFLFGSILILVIFARATFRKILLLLFGFILVHGILFVVYYWYEKTSDLWAHFYVANVTEFASSLVGIKSILILGAVPISYFVISLFMLTREARFTKYQSQLFQIIFLWLGIAIVQVSITSERTPHSFFSFIPSLAYFISHYLLLIRRKFIAEGMLWIFVLSLITMNIVARRGALDSVNYAGLFPGHSAYEKLISDKKIMIVGDDVPLLKNNKLGGYFLNWDLSRKYFESPSDYRSVIRINNAIMEDSPDVIIDESGLMEPFLVRIPLLEKNYRREKEIYWKR